MAYTKILVIHNRLDKCLDYAQDKEKTALSLAEAIDYALNRDKTEQACFETGINCDVEAAWQDMLSTKRRWGKVQRKRQGYHIIQSFAPGEVTPEEAHAVGVEFAQRLFGERYEAIVTTHLNKAHLHNHVVVNSVSMLDGAMYRDTFQDYYGGDGVGIRGTSDATCQAHGLSVIEPDPENPDRRRSRPEWEGKTTIRDTVRWDIDAALGRAYTLQSLLQELRRMGYQVQAGNRKHISIRPPGGAGNIRLDSLGDGYTEAAGGHPHRPAAAWADTPGVPVAVPRPEIPCPGRLPAPRSPETAWVSSPVLQIPVSPPLLPEGPSADTDGLFHAPGTYQTGPLSTAVSISPPKPY